MPLAVKNKAGTEWGGGGGTREFRSGCQQNRPYNASGGFGGEL